MWNQAETANQKFAFRYFQQLEGAVMLPAGFSPQRVRIALKGPFGGIEKSFSWESPAPAMAGSTEPQTKE